jgi:hypothetical protein
MILWAQLKGLEVFILQKSKIEIVLSADFYFHLGDGLKVFP